MEICFDENVARGFIKELMTNYENNSFYDKIEQLEYMKPEAIKRKSREHANFLFYTAMITPSSVSETIFKRSIEKFNKNKKVFEPPEVIKMSNLEAQLKGLESRKQMLSAWMFNSNLLVSNYDSDSRKIFGVDSYEKAIDEIKKFYKFGDKVGSMLLGWFIEQQIIENGWDDVYSMYTPLDIQVMKLLVGRGIVSFEGEMHYHTLFDYTRKNLQPLFEELEVNPYLFHDAAWRLSSKQGNLCPRCVLSKPVECFLRDPCKSKLDMDRLRSNGTLSILNKELRQRTLDDLC